MDESHESRIEALERGQADLRVQAEAMKGTIASMDRDIRANTALTQQVKEDTAETVELLKSIKVSGRAVRWLLGIAVAVGAAMVQFKGWWK